MPKEEEESFRKGQPGFFNEAITYGVPIYRDDISYLAELSRAYEKNFKEIFERLREG